MEAFLTKLPDLITGLDLIGLSLIWGSLLIFMCCYNTRDLWCEDYKDYNTVLSTRCNNLEIKLEQLEQSLKKQIEQMGKKLETLDNAVFLPDSDRDSDSSK